MAATALVEPLARAHVRPGVRVSESRTFSAAVTLIALHIIDDEFLQPAPGTSVQGHLRAGLLPLGVALAAAWMYPRLRAGLRAGIALSFGILSIVAGMIVLGSASANGVTGSDWSGLPLLPTGLTLITMAAWIPWHERGLGAHTRRRRWVNRAIAIVATSLMLFYLVMPIGAALWSTHKYRTPIGTFSIPHQDARFRTSDGLFLSGWYVPSHNGAAIVIVHGGGGDRAGDRTHAALLARAGYGVLLYDARGRGQSQGAPDAYGWTWGRDVDAAITWLEHRPDVKDGRIGALGLSTGADVLIEAAARRHDIRAVVDDGATIRSIIDTEKVIRGGDVLSIPFWWTQYTTAEILTNAAPGPPLATLAAHLHTRILFVASNWSVERTASKIYARAAKQPGDLWEVDSGHTQGLRDHPRQYTQHVLSFFATALYRPPSPMSSTP